MMKRIALSVLALASGIPVVALAPAAAQTAPPGYGDYAPDMREAVQAATLPPPQMDPRLAPAAGDYAGAELPAGWQPAPAAAWQSRGQSQGQSQGYSQGQSQWQGTAMPAGGAIVPAAMTMQDGRWSSGPQGGVVLAGWPGGRGGDGHGGWDRGGNGHGGWGRGDWGRGGWDEHRGGWDRGGWGRGGWDDHRGGWGGYRGYPVYNGWGGYRPRDYHRPPVVIYGGGWGGGYYGQPSGGYYGQPYGGYYGQPYGGYYGQPYGGYYGRCRPNGSGALIGGVTGATLGYGLGNHWDRTPGVIIGGVVGAIAGSAIERSRC